MTFATAKLTKDVDMYMNDARTLPQRDTVTDGENMLLIIRRILGLEQVTRLRMEGVPLCIIGG